MGQVSPYLRSITDGYAWWCPACEEVHAVWVNGKRGANWTFNGDVNRPTFSPSVKVTYRHPKGHTNENPAPVDYKGEYVTDVCHFYITNGEIRFCGDCTHPFAGKTVPLPPLPPELQDKP